MLIDDTYNANPDSARAALAVLALAAGTKLFVLGDMGELGPGAGELHAGIGETARAAGVKRLYTLGELARQAAQSFGAGAREFKDADALVAAVRADLSPQATVLVKGSRFMKMERVVAALGGDRVEGRGSRDGGKS
jgi:UDP-N-acetylmuramoyl-tripeptide--D-alanyl-D-alanine ligase